MCLVAKYITEFVKQQSNKEYNNAITQLEIQINNLTDTVPCRPTRTCPCVNDLWLRQSVPNETKQLLARYDLCY